MILAQHPPGGPADAPRRDLASSLLLVTTVVGFALAGLALQGNWPKIVRVGTAAAAYVGTLLPRARRRASAERASPLAGPLPYWWFALAGALAGVTSGMLHPDRNPLLVAVSALLAATLLGGLHWFALRTWRRLRAQLVGW